MFRHSARNRLLNASMNALSVGLPGREKFSVTPRVQAHRSRSRDTNSDRWSTRIAFNLLLADVAKAALYAAWTAFVANVAWVIATVVPAGPATVSTVAPSCWASALTMPVPSPVFG